MSDNSLDINQSQLDVTSATGSGGVRDYFALMKPRVMSLVLFTALVGMVVAPGTVHPVIAIVALLCIAIGAGASGALNMWYDADIDALMQRTAARPIPRGIILPEEALTFGTILSLGSVLCMGLLVNWFAAGLLAFTIGFYIFIYTMWLKRRTPQNIVIGGASGALPPMVGWAAVTGGVSFDAAMLFVIIFIWTPPHFWALALYRTRDYERAGIPMLPVTAGPDATRRQILIYSLILAPVGLAPAFTGLGGAFYAASATLLGAVFVAMAIRVYTRREGAKAELAARQLFSYSIWYLMLLFAILLGEHSLGSLVGAWAIAGG